MAAGACTVTLLQMPSLKSPSKPRQMAGLTSADIVRLIKQDREALRELAASITADPELRLAVISAVFTEVATKQDIRELRAEISQLRKEMREEISQSRTEAATHFRWIVGIVIVVWGTTFTPHEAHGPAIDKHPSAGGRPRRLSCTWSA